MATNHGKELTEFHQLLSAFAGRKLARHELGHYVVARALRFQTGDVSLKIFGAQAGHEAEANVKLATSTGSIDEVRRYLQRRVIVLYAGSCAENLNVTSRKVHNDNAIASIRTPPQGAEQDHAKAQEFITLLRNMLNPNTDPAYDSAVQRELNELDAKLWNQAVKYVEESADTIISLADRLATRVVLFNQKFTMSKAELENLPEVLQIPKADLSKDFLA